MATLTSTTTFTDDDPSGGARTYTQVFHGTEDAVKAARNAINKKDAQLPTQHFPDALAGEMIYSISVSRELGKSAFQGGKWLITITSGAAANYREEYPKDPPKSYPHHTCSSIAGERPIVSMSQYVDSLAMWAAEPNPLLKKQFKYRNPNGGIESLSDKETGDANNVSSLNLAKWIMQNGASIPASDEALETTFEDDDITAARARKIGLMKVDTSFSHPMKQDGFSYVKMDCRIVEARNDAGTTVWHTTIRWLGRPKWHPEWLYGGA